MRARAVITLGLVLGFATLAFTPINADGAQQARRNRRDAQIEESAKPETMKGGVEIQTALPYEEVWQRVVRFFQSNNLTIDATLSNRDIGQVVSTFPSQTDEARTKRTGYWTSVQIIRGATTTVRVQVGQKEQTKLMAGLWRNPKLHEEKTSAVAKGLEEVLRAGS